MTDLMIIIGLTLACCVAVGLIGLALLHLVRYRSLRQQLTIATLLPVVAVAATVLINVQLMFLSAHDSLVILIALLFAAARRARRLAGGASDLACLTPGGRRPAPARLGLGRQHAGGGRRVGRDRRRAARARTGAGRPGRNPPDPCRIAGSRAGCRTVPPRAGELHVP